MKTVGLKLVDEEGKVYLKGNKCEPYYKDDYEFESGDGICFVPKQYLEALSVVYLLKDDFISEDTLVDAGIAYRRKDIFRIAKKMVDDAAVFKCRGKFISIKEMEHYEEFVVHIVNKLYYGATEDDYGDTKLNIGKMFRNFCKKHHYNDLEYKK